MSRRQGRSTAPLSSARLIDVDDLPIGLIDVELSTPPTELVDDTAASLLGPAQGPPAGEMEWRPQDQEGQVEIAPSRGGHNLSIVVRKA